MIKYVKLSILIAGCMGLSLMGSQGVAAILAAADQASLKVAQTSGDKKAAEANLKKLITTAAFQNKDTKIAHDNEQYDAREACRSSLKAQLLAAGIVPTAQQAKLYGNQEINRETLVRLASAPANVEHAATQWLTENPDFVKAALGYEFMIGAVRPCHEKTWKLMEQKGLANLSQCNYVFQIPGTEYVMQVAGHVNRKENMKRLASVLAGTQYQWGKPLSVEDWELFRASLGEGESDKVTGKKKELLLDYNQGVNKVARVLHMPKTYQTASRAATGLLFKEVANRHQFKYVVAPDTFIVHIPGRPEALSDRNYVTVQRMEKDLEDVVALSAEEENEVVIILREIGLFCCNKGSLKRRKSDKKLVLLDFEQPNNSNPLDFFHKDYERFLGNGDAGLWDYIENYVITKK